MTTATLDAQVNARWIALWLAVCAATILGMILLGGVTRLTESGLSMVDWRQSLNIFSYRVIVARFGFKRLV